MTKKNGSKWILQVSFDQETGVKLEYYVNMEKGYVMDSETFESLGDVDPDEYIENYRKKFHAGD